MNYWIFKCNPQRFRIEERLQDPEPRTTWLITRYRDEIMPGDLAFSRPRISGLPVKRVKS